MEPCRLFSEAEIEPLKKSRELYLQEVSQSKGFAETFSTFGRITWIEASIPRVICSSRVPVKETRKLLRCRSAEETSNVPVFQFMKRLFDQIGFKIELVEIGPYRVLIRVLPPIYESAVKQKKTCYTTAEAVFRFFSKDLGLKCSVEETRCVNAGASSCDFYVVLEPLTTCGAAFDMKDRLLLLLLSEKKDQGTIAQELGIEPASVHFRLGFLREYGAIDGRNDLTELGTALLAVLRDHPEDEDFRPPWEEISEASDSISMASSFAEAMKDASKDRDKGRNG